MWCAQLRASKSTRAEPAQAMTHHVWLSTLNFLILFKTNLIMSCRVAWVETIWEDVAKPKLNKLSSRICSSTRTKL